MTGCGKKTAPSASPAKSGSVSVQQSAEVPREFENALKKAESYNDMMAFSKKGLYRQLTSEAEGFTPEEAKYALANMQK